VREIEWTEPALADLAVLDKGIARRIKQAVERFAATGTGNVKRLLRAPRSRDNRSEVGAISHSEASEIGRSELSVIGQDSETK
jgi:hypothetical protein